MTTGCRLDGKITLKEFVITRIWLSREKPWVWWVLLLLVIWKL